MASSIPTNAFLGQLKMFKHIYRTTEAGGGATAEDLLKGV